MLFHGIFNVYSSLHFTLSQLHILISMIYTKPQIVGGLAPKVVNYNSNFLVESKPTRGRLRNGGSWQPKFPTGMGVSMAMGVPNSWMLFVGEDRKIPI